MTQHSLPDLQTFFGHWFTKQSPVTSVAIRTLQVLGRDVRHTLHQRGHITRCWLVMLPSSVRSRSNRCTLSKPWNKFIPCFRRAAAFRLMVSRFGWDGANLYAPRHLLLECQDGWLAVWSDKDATSVSEATDSLPGSFNDISGIDVGASSLDDSCSNVCFSRFVTLGEAAVHRIFWH